MVRTRTRLNVDTWLCSTARSDATGKRSGRAAEKPRASWRDSSAAQHNVPVLVRNVATRDPQMTHVDRGNSPVCGSPPRPFLNRTCMFFKAACASLGKKTALGTNTQDNRAYMYSSTCRSLPLAVLVQQAGAKRFPSDVGAPTWSRAHVLSTLYTR